MDGSLQHHSVTAQKVAVLRSKDQQDGDCTYRFATPRTIFFTFFLRSPRAPVRLGLGGAFLRDARLAFLRSSLDNLLVLAIRFVNSLSNLIAQKKMTRPFPAARTSPPTSSIRSEEIV